MHRTIISPTPTQDDKPLNLTAPFYVASEFMPFGSSQIELEEDVIFHLSNGQTRVLKKGTKLYIDFKSARDYLEETSFKNADDAWKKGKKWKAILWGTWELLTEYLPAVFYYTVISNNVPERTVTSAFQQSTESDLNNPFYGIQSNKDRKEINEVIWNIYSTRGKKSTSKQYDSDVLGTWDKIYDTGKKTDSTPINRIAICSILAVAAFFLIPGFGIPIGIALALNVGRELVKYSIHFYVNYQNLSHPAPSESAIVANSPKQRKPDDYKLIHDRLLLPIPSPTSKLTHASFPSSLGSSKFIVDASLKQAHKQESCRPSSETEECLSRKGARA